MRRKKQTTLRFKNYSPQYLKSVIKDEGDSPNNSPTKAPEIDPVKSEPDFGDVKFTTNTGRQMNMTDLFMGRPVFLISSGPSLNHLNLERIRDCSAFSFGVNNSWSIFKPDFWTCADSPDRFLYSCWKDPKILKLCPSSLRNKNLKKKVSGEFKTTDEQARDCPNTLFYSRNLSFNHLTFLEENTVNWGCTGDKPGTLGFKGARSVFLAALKLCYVLGFRTVYLCGVDFKMEEGIQNYAFEQERSPSSVKGNNCSYNVNGKRLNELNKLFMRHNFRVLNCNPLSHLTAFPFISFDEAIEESSKLVVPYEGSLGWYDGECKDKKMKVKRN